MIPASQDPAFLGLLLAHRIRRSRARDEAAGYAVGLRGYLPADYTTAQVAKLFVEASEDQEIIRLVTMTAYIAMQTIETKRKRIQEIIGIVRAGVESAEYRKSLLLEAETLRVDITELAELVERIDS